MISFIALGSNMGDKENYLNKAIDLIEKRAGKVLKRSTILKTEPYGYTDQDEFLNMAIKIDTELTPRQLLETLLKIELELDRVRKITWGPRTIDLDIIYYGDEIVDEPDLQIPHIDLYNRDFVLEPVAEIDKNFIDPRKNKTVGVLLEELNNKK